MHISQSFLAIQVVPKVLVFLMDLESVEPLESIESLEPLCRTQDL